MNHVICPRCGAINSTDAMNCQKCRINLNFALENPELAKGIIPPTQATQVVQEFSPSKSGASGFLIGMICGLICVALFAVFESFRMAALDDSFAFEDTFPVVFGFTVIFGNLFVFLPAGVGGYILELLLRHRSKKGILTEKWATIAGIVLAGSAVVLACGIGLAFLAFVPHNGWRYFLTTVKNGSFFADFQYYIEYLIKFLSRMFLEITVASILACLAGAVAGKYLARRINRTQFI